LSFFAISGPEGLRKLWFFDYSDLGISFGVARIGRARWQKG